MQMPTFKYRIVLTVFLLEAILIAVVLWLTLTASFSGAKEQISKNEEVTLSLLSNLSRIALFTEEYTELQTYLEQIQKEDPRITHVLLQDSIDRVVVSTRFDEIGIEQYEFEEVDNHQWHTSKIENHSGKLGTLAVQFSNELIISAYNKARDLGVTIGLVGMVIIAMIGLLTGTLLTRRLEKLKSATREIADGNWKARTELKGDDELAQLGQDFDSMADKLEAGMQTIQSNELQFRQVTENIREVFWLSEPDKSKFIYISPAYEKIWGRSCESLYQNPMSYLEAIYPEDRKMVKQELSSQEGEGYDIVYRIIRPEGSIRWIWDRAFPVEDEFKKVYRIAGISEDITDRTQADARNKKLSSALEQTADAVIITDATGVIEYVNPAFEVMTGYERDEALGRLPSLIKSGKHDQEYYHHLWLTICSGRVFQDTIVNRRKDGSLYYEEKTITPLIDYSGNITHFISTGKDITARIRTEERLEHLAYHDVLTQLPNRALFVDRLAHAIVKRSVEEQPLAVMFLDLDRFKNINDSLGHDVGDELLKSVRGRLIACVREGDTVARFGGDEFAIMLEGLRSDEDAPAIAGKLLEVLAEPVVVDGHELFVTTSIGISLYPNDSDIATTLLKYADAAMYKAKESGRNNYKFYSAGMGEKAIERLSLETKLRHALERDEFLLNYQPQVDIQSGDIFGFEALIRWQHPDLGLVSPMKFIPLLEDTGLILQVGQWVIKTACQYAGDLVKLYSPPLRMSVNVSGRQFHDPEMTAFVESALKDSGLDPSLLELEITESVLMQNDKTTLSNLRALSGIGVKLSIDDFGTGYSSLSYLKRFPIDSLKIDRAFIGDITTDPDDAGIVKAIIAMAHNLKIQTIAEGVETTEQFEFLRENKCDLMQGYLFSKPLSVEDTNKLLKATKKKASLDINKVDGKNQKTAN